MNTSDLDSLTLLIVRDAAEGSMWTEQWAYGYPTVQTAQCAAGQSIGQWQQTVQTAAMAAAGGGIALVGHGAGANAVAAWYYQTDTAMQRRIRAVILAAPLQAACRDDEQHTFCRVRFNCKTALVVGRDDPQSPQDWAADTARLWQARFFTAPQSGHLNRGGDNWQWGMKLLQEMLL